jgi:hypothetical protein
LEEFFLKRDFFMKNPSTETPPRDGERHLVGKTHWGKAGNELFEETMEQELEPAFLRTKEPIEKEA